MNHDSRNVSRVFAYRQVTFQSEALYINQVFEHFPEGIFSIL